MQPTVLVSWSGGIDSTSCLWQLLRDGCSVLAHHVVLKTPEGRWEAESKAIKAQREWFARHGYSFIYHETGFDYGTIRKFTRDINITAFTAGFVLIGYPTVSKAVISSSADDERRLGTDPAIQARRRQLTELMAGRQLGWLSPSIRKPKTQVMAEMPPDLLSLCWYCRRPREGKPCGQCRTCREVAAGREAMNQ